MFKSFIYLGDNRVIDRDSGVCSLVSVFRISGLAEVVCSNECQSSL